MKKIIATFATIALLTSVSAQAAIFNGEVTKVIANDLQIQPDGTRELQDRVWLQPLNEETGKEVENMPIGTHIKAHGPSVSTYFKANAIHDGFIKRAGMIYKIERK